MRSSLILAATILISSGCKPPPLEYTKGQVRFARSREDFYRARWQRSASAAQPKICAGFVHNKRFGHYLKYGSFRLAMALQVFLGGGPVITAGRITGWREGKLLRTLQRRIRVGPSNKSYVWCGRLRKGGTWKVGAMRFVFVLQGPERAMGEKLATGVLRITR